MNSGIVPVKYHPANLAGVFQLKSGERVTVGKQLHFIYFHTS
jgi:hypothetical protein